MSFGVLGVILAKDLSGDTCSTRGKALFSVSSFWTNQNWSKWAFRRSPLVALLLPLRSFDVCCLRRRESGLFRLQTREVYPEEIDVGFQRSFNVLLTEACLSCLDRDSSCDSCRHHPHQRRRHPRRLLLFLILPVRK